MECGNLRPKPKPKQNKKQTSKLTNEKNQTKPKKEPSLQLQYQLVKKIKPLHDGQNKTNPFQKGQDTLKALVDLSGELFL